MGEVSELPGSRLCQRERKEEREERKGNWTGVLSLF
jgi:hypothetical protein